MLSHVAQAKTRVGFPKSFQPCLDLFNIRAQARFISRPVCRSAAATEENAGIVFLT